MILYDRRRFSILLQFTTNMCYLKLFLAFSWKLFPADVDAGQGRKEAITILCVSIPRLQSHRQHKINIMNDDDVILNESP